MKKYILLISMVLSTQCLADSNNKKSERLTKSIQSSKNSYTHDFNNTKVKLCDGHDFWLVSKWDSSNSQGEYIDHYIANNYLLQSLPIYGDTRITGGQRGLDIVFDKNGKPLFMVRGYLAGITCVDLTNSGSQEIYIEVNTRGGNASAAFVVLSQDRNNDLKVIYESYAVTKFVDFNRDNIREAIWVTGDRFDGYEYHADCYNEGAYSKCKNNYSNSYLEKQFNNNSFIGPVF